MGDKLTHDGVARFEVVEITPYEGVIVDELEPNFGARLLLDADGEAMPDRDDHLRRSTGT